MTQPFHNYAYDAYGRFAQVSNFQFQAAYSYLPGTDLLSGYTLADPVSSFEFQVFRTYETNRLIASVENRFNANLISRFDYTNDSLHQRFACQTHPES